MAFTREYIRKLAKESEVELPKEFIDGLISEHINARDVYTDEQVKAALENNSSNSKSNIEDSEEYKKLKKLYDDEKTAHKKLKDDIADKEQKVKENDALEKYLKSKGYKDIGIKKILKYGNYKPELDDSGNIKDDGEKLLNSVNEEWHEYREQVIKEGVGTAMPPTGSKPSSGSSSSTGRAKELAKQYHDNLYGSSETSN